MFGLSFSKIIVLVAVVVAVWYGFKWLNRVDKLRKEEAARDKVDQKKRMDEAARASAAPTPPASGAEDLVSCAACGSYVLASAARSCGRRECPYPG